jgi:hypothetical protein
MNGRFQMQGGKNLFFPKEMNANRFFWDSHWLEIWSNHFYPSMGPNGGSVAMDSELEFLKSLWGLGTEEEKGFRTVPPGYIGWRNSFLGINAGAP